MSLQLKVVIGVVIIIYLITVIFLIRKNHFRIKYSLLWLFSGLMMLLLDFFPQILYHFTKICGIELPINGLFSIALFCVILINMSLTGALSKISENNKSLTQKLGVLEKRVRELEEREGCDCEREEH